MAVNGLAWKERPRRFIEPSLVTSTECTAYKQGVAKELKEGSVQAAKDVERLGGEAALEKPNRYLDLYRHPKAEPVSNEIRWGYDRVNDDTTYDPHTPRDTLHPRHTEAARKKCKVELKTLRQLRSSQAYGWLPALDGPNYGFGRTSVFLDSSMDKSHLMMGGPWTAR
mmetsp:Transcript_54273/g.142931  ORF Transcript_54273/g.142931 Transcript_54273/m.142931 type:complete len:168 (-) Transcript_54273:11-514(-)